MKRYLSAALAALILVAATLPAPTLARDVVTQSRQSQAEMTPALALDMLKAGNKRFVSGQSLVRDYRAQVKQTGAGQYPFATVLSCIDSRTAPEIIFDQGLGDVFSPRIAANFVNDDILGSMEFASKLAGARLIVVLGHTECGAIKGACDGAQLGNLTQMLAKVQPAVNAISDDGSARNSSNAAFVQQVAEMNVRMTVQQIKERSPVLREMVESGEIRIVGAMYDVKTGKVEFYDE
jgi:carbonic anhydrase